MHAEPGFLRGENGSKTQQQGKNDPSHGLSSDFGMMPRGARRCFP
jgi:hypothetical protein